MIWPMAREPIARTNEEMVDTQIAARGVQDPFVLAAMRKVDRALFVPPELHHEAYADAALPVAYGQTISQPYIVGLMTEALAPDPNDRVLEIGCGTGYQTAILAELVREVWSIEIVPELAAAAKERLKRLGYHNVHVLVGDGWKGLPEKAPFDKIIVTAAPDVVPPALLDQLEVGGIMVVPVGVGSQELLKIVRETPDKFREYQLGPVRFVPMVHGGLV
ncbi:MAG: protein-L-isoaspartate O-methyltransferase [Candidatus Sumerlaea sp.]|jgi:protein-L-isoaspartate(D-aspartate) O-methyltransferase|uniref:Protein-L-isoaspartate O-methyltransferase n=1 Tax=Sumerlaea chitinivorans TaxID=2250252 RepID=A0A2Z4Y8T4_SUMC1|nr:Protein-L-isoaspartate O-methyltransferase [Candidatus Sumerlaea chitinivorans]MCX7962975.1 protein-L-isoaspartate(D-aspartate) O-methyltransferase [Candidatus Sumerlaea chitinivorans]GIX43881.1 MAG: protein-L-isoaspartate O-methyltransferase [Candidatus Sumerlaea sp.]